MQGSFGFAPGVLQNPLRMTQAPHGMVSGEGGPHGLQQGPSGSSGMLQGPLEVAHGMQRFLAPSEHEFLRGPLSQRTGQEQFGSDHGESGMSQGQGLSGMGHGPSARNGQGQSLVMGQGPPRGVILGIGPGMPMIQTHGPHPGIGHGPSQGMGQGIPQGIGHGPSPGLGQHQGPPGMGQGRPPIIGQGSAAGMGQGPPLGIGQGLPLGISHGPHPGMGQGPPFGMGQGPPSGIGQGPPPGMGQGPPPGMGQGPPPGMRQGPPPGMEQGPPIGIGQGPLPGMGQGPSLAMGLGPPPGVTQGPPGMGQGLPTGIGQGPYHGIGQGPPPGVGQRLLGLSQVQPLGSIHGPPSGMIQVPPPGMVQGPLPPRLGQGPPPQMILDASGTNLGPRMIMTSTVTRLQESSRFEQESPRGARQEDNEKTGCQQAGSSQMTSSQRDLLQQSSGPQGMILGLTQGLPGLLGPQPLFGKRPGDLNQSRPSGASADENGPPGLRLFSLEGPRLLAPHLELLQRKHGLDGDSHNNGKPGDGGRRDFRRQPSPPSSVLGDRLLAPRSSRGGGPPSLLSMPGPLNMPEALARSLLLQHRDSFAADRRLPRFEGRQFGQHFSGSKDLPCGSNFDRRRNRCNRDSGYNNRDERNDERRWYNNRDDGGSGRRDLGGRRGYIDNRRDNWQEEEEDWPSKRSRRSSEGRSPRRQSCLVDASQEEPVDHSQSNCSANGIVVDSGRSSECEPSLDKSKIPTESPVLVNVKDTCGIQGEPSGDVVPCADPAVSADSAETAVVSS